MAIPDATSYQSIYEVRLPLNIYLYSPLAPQVWVYEGSHSQPFLFSPPSNQQVAHERMARDPVGLPICILNGGRYKKRGEIPLERCDGPVCYLYSSCFLCSGVEVFECWMLAVCPSVLGNISPTAELQLATFTPPKKNVRIQYLYVIISNFSLPKTTCSSNKKHRNQLPRARALMGFTRSVKPLGVSTPIFASAMATAEVTRRSKMERPSERSKCCPRPSIKYMKPLPATRNLLV